MTLYYQVGHVGGILGSLQISSFGLHTWKILCNLSCSSGSGQFLPLLGWLPGSPSFPSAKSSPFFECLSPILLVSNRRYLLTSFFNHVKNILFSQTRVLFDGGEDWVLPSWWAQLIEESPIQSICSAMAILNVAAEDLQGATAPPLPSHWVYSSHHSLSKSPPTCHALFRRMVLLASKPLFFHICLVGYYSPSRY